MNYFKKFIHVGVGGRKCVCCFPAPGSRARRLEYRRIRRAVKNDTKREISMLDPKEGV